MSEDDLLPRSEAALLAMLEQEGPTFSFVQAVSLIERMHRGAIAVGESGPPSKEAIRFQHDPSLAFPSGDVTSVKPRVPRHGLVFAEVMTTFLGLTGANSPLPTQMAEDVLRNEEEGASLRHFYDILHHRLISLFYRAWKKSRMYATHRSDGQDRLTRRALAFVGVDGFGAPQHLGLAPIDLLSLAPLLGVRTRSARTLEIVLARVFPGIDVGVDSFQTRRVMLGDDQCAKLGRQNGTLGENFTIGRSVLDRSGRFGVQIGPVDYPLFEALLPGGQHHTKLREIVQQFTRGVLEAGVEVLLREDQTPRFKLGSAGSKLGITTTLRSPEGKALKARFVLSDNPEDARATMIS
jgi:type VI secretion system protein ImpH